ncbi:MerR family transcriptional regulator [Nonomuraea jiangxiensis]|uniref:DNA-binding transcriptional regulator, MerR family n=1 Tax=Nonomuraea jiangxiensis TaxID=633440 RepID=A0A1G8Q7J8_9ACTN|nr:MerR family transcriptional regulator [Nonomuraea jiangxiensis]SDJ00526.1 DNA-binding transcriptional regulator, MerR family [Nonomuraea jiangxiensis]
MRIGELAAKSGVSVRALRYYEEQGLLEATRSYSGQRHYPEPATDRVQLIQMLYAAGLSSKTIAELLPCVEARVNTPESRARLAAERDRIEAQIAALTRTRDRLDAVIAISESPESGCTYVPDRDVAAEAGHSVTS